jgi:hypothetical protein
VPARLKHVLRVVGDCGLTYAKPRSRSHWLVKSASKSYPIPAHNGLKTEIDYEDFKARL